MLADEGLEMVEGPQSLPKMTPAVAGCYDAPRPLVLTSTGRACRAFDAAGAQRGGELWVSEQPILLPAGMRSPANGGAIDLLRHRCRC